MVAKVVFGSCPHSVSLCPKMDIGERTSVIPGSRMGYHWAEKSGGVAPTKIKKTLISDSSVLAPDQLDQLT